MSETVAFVGATGGAGTTRVAVECAATLARAGRSVAVLDAALATQGLARYAEGRIDPDLTSVLTDEAPLGDAFVPAWPDLPGRAALAPVHAPFERVARAKTEAAARRLESALRQAATEFEHVIVDVPPVADNAAVAAVTSADQCALVAPAGQRGRDALPRMRGRLSDVGVAADAVVATRPTGDGSQVPDADYQLPAGDRDAVPPTCVSPDADFAPAVAEVAGDLFDATLDLEFPSEGLLG